jgi:hypothetical protein
VWNAPETTYAATAKPPAWCVCAEISRVKALNPMDLVQIYLCQHMARVYHPLLSARMLELLKICIIGHHRVVGLKFRAMGSYQAPMGVRP